MKSLEEMLDEVFLDKNTISNIGDQSCKAELIVHQLFSDICKDKPDIPKIMYGLFQINNHLKSMQYIIEDIRKTDPKLFKKQWNEK